jgi:hypothetical protein
LRKSEKAGDWRIIPVYKKGRPGSTSPGKRPRGIGRAIVGSLHMRGHATWALSIPTWMTLPIFRQAY